MSPLSIKSGPGQSKPLTVRLDANLERRLHSAAELEGISVSDFVRQAIGDRLDRGAAGSSLWDRVASSVVKNGSSRKRRTNEGGTHSEFAVGLEAETATKWRRLDK